MASIQLLDQRTRAATCRYTSSSRDSCHASAHTFSAPGPHSASVYVCSFPALVGNRSSCDSAYATQGGWTEHQRTLWTCRVSNPAVARPMCSSLLILAYPTSVTILKGCVGFHTQPLYNKKKLQLQKNIEAPSMKPNMELNPDDS